ncbi:hypothetical protein N3C64_05175 [Sedimentimonas flavescens]|nr:hypothetical protein [Sedimentimonas flavescens]
MAAIGCALCVFTTLLLLMAETMRKTRSESSLLQGRRQIAGRLGLGAHERLAQSPAMLAAQVWALRLATVAAYCFTCWQIANAVI